MWKPATLKPAGTLNDEPNEKAKFPFRKFSWDRKFTRIRSAAVSASDSSSRLTWPLSNTKPATVKPAGTLNDEPNEKAKFPFRKFSWDRKFTRVRSAAVSA